MGLGYWGSRGFRVLGFRGLGVRGFRFLGLVFRGLGALESAWTLQNPHVRDVYAYTYSATRRSCPLQRGVPLGQVRSMYVCR